MKTLKILTIGAILLLVACKGDQKKEEVQEVDDQKVEEKVNEEELKYVLDNTFPVGDVRRYGVVPGKGYATHPVSKKDVLQTILDLSQDQGIEMSFPKGYYKGGIIIKGKQNVSLTFDDAEFAGPVYIIDDAEKNASENIDFKGKLITYNQLHTAYSSEITIEDITVKSNPELSNSKSRSLGCDIFRGTKDLLIGNLTIEDLDSGNSTQAKRAAAAVLIHGWGANPEYVSINKIHIKSSDKHGVYLTGSNHEIGEIIIDKFGAGSSAHIDRMQDADPGEEKKIAGLWVNRCNNSQIGNVKINTKDSKGSYAIWLDDGKAAEPTIINQVTLDGGDAKLKVFATEASNVAIKEVK